MVWIGFKTWSIELLVRSINLIIPSEGVWFTTPRGFFLVLQFAMAPHITSSKVYIFVFVDWILWLRYQGGRVLSLPSLAVLLTLCIVGYVRGNKSTAIRFSVLVLYIVVSGETYSHKVIALCQYLTGIWRVTSLSVSVLRCLI